MKEVFSIQASLERGDNPRDAKLRLAETLVSLYCDEKSAQKEKENFLKAFSNKETPTDMPEISVEKGASLSNTLKVNGIVTSKAEFQRLADAGAITNLKSNQKIGRFDDKVDSDIDIKVGKHRFVRLIIK